MAFMKERKMTDTTPSDEVLIEAAREIAAEQMRSAGVAPPWINQLMAGGLEGSPIYQAALAGIRRGMEIKHD
jgi:hypothetical protein